MHDPDVIARIDGDARHGADDPMIRQRLGPRGIDAECRYLAGHWCRLLCHRQSYERQHGGREQQNGGPRRV